MLFHGAMLQQEKQEGKQVESPMDSVFLATDNELFTGRRNYVAVCFLTVIQCTKGELSKVKSTARLL